jgi:hypothetical protein
MASFFLVVILLQRGFQEKAIALVGVGLLQILLNTTVNNPSLANSFITTLASNLYAKITENELVSSIVHARLSSFVDKIEVDKRSKS